jgi:hypothetical protein
MNRRKWMTMSAGCFAALVCDHVEASSLTNMHDVSVRDATDAFDHILLGAGDLDVGIRWVEERTGVRAKFGGNHPGAGTRNALLSLGTAHYLEIIAPDPAQANAPDVRGLRELSSPRIIQWAIHTEDIAAAKGMVEAAGIKTVGPQPGSRQRPDGKLLRWQALRIEQTTPLVPFFIHGKRVRRIRPRTHLGSAPRSRSTSRLRTPTNCVESCTPPLYTPTSANPPCPASCWWFKRRKARL